MLHPIAASGAAMADDSTGNKLLRFLTCGSVDDGKSTLIGRLLFDCHVVLEDQLAALQTDSARFGSNGGKLDLALLVDGLQAEREQGITIDVAYRYFATAKRKFIVADTPGHEQYTRNMVTGASNADLAVLLIDASKGLLPQTRRHSHIVSLLGIRHVVVVVNKMDAIGWDRAQYERIEQDYLGFAADLGFKEVLCIPASALEGDNVTRPSGAASWYRGPTLLDYLESVEVEANLVERPFRMPVQWVNRPDPRFRGYCGSIVSGRVRAGERIVIAPSGLDATVARIVTFDGDLPEAAAGQAVTLVLAEEIDVSRGDVFCAAEARPIVAAQFSAHMIWMSEQPMLPGRSYLLQTGTSLVPAQITELKHKISVGTMEHIAAKHLDLNEIGLCNLVVDRPIAFDSYADNRGMGAFILIDRISNATVAGGMIDFALRRSSNIHWQALKIDKAARAASLGQRPCVLWLTGLSGAGKSTIANLVEQRLHQRGNHTALLDGDNVRHGLNRDLGFTDEDRVENIRRVAEVAKLMVEAGLIVIVSFISPFRSERAAARALVDNDEFIEIFVDTPLSICEARDPKGLYKLARAGKLPNLTGIGSAYEPPVAAELVLPAGSKPAELLADDVIALLERRGLV